MSDIVERLRAQRVTVSPGYLVPNQLGLEAADAIVSLADAVGQLLDDMGKQGQSVCLLAKAQARVAFEPFRTDDNYSGDNYNMTLAEAQELIAAHNAIG